MTAEPQHTDTDDNPQRANPPALEKKQQHATLPSDPFYRTIVENNIFAPLGTAPAPKTPTYRLLATILSPKRDIGSTAVIENIHTHQTYYCRLGEKIGEATLVDIQSKQVTLETDGEQTTLTLTPHLWLGK